MPEPWHPISSTEPLSLASRNQNFKSPLRRPRAHPLLPSTNNIDTRFLFIASSSYTTVCHSFQTYSPYHLLITPKLAPTLQHISLTMQLQTLFACASFLAAAVAQASSQRIAFSGVLPSTVHAGTPVNLQWTGGDGSVSFLFLSRNRDKLLTAMIPVGRNYLSAERLNQQSPDCHRLD